MLSRPKPGESEDDLLKFQSQFLAAGGSAAAKVVRKADKRKGTEHASEETSEGTEGRDVVSIEDFPDLPPILTPGPSKKSKVTRTRVCFADEDPEDILEKNDHHITAVISKIIERDTSAATITAPVPTGEPFPRVFHRSEIPSGATPEMGKVSIFAQKMAAKRAAEAAKKAESSSVLSQAGHFISPTLVLADESKSPHLKDESGKDQPRLITGEGLRRSEAHEEAQRIHEENVNKLKALSEEEILQQRERLLSQLDPKLVAFLRSKSKDPGTQGDASAGDTAGGPQTVGCKSSASATNIHASKEIPEEEREHQTALSVDDLPVKPQKEWVHMDTVEFEKLEWIKDLPQTRQKKTKKGMQARFSLKGDLIPPNEEIPTHMGLHHHGDEAERAGYSLQELFHLSRSQFIQQRTLSLQVLGRIVKKAKQGEFASVLKGSVLRLLLDAGFLFLLRFSIDDNIDSVIAASVATFHALLVSPEDEEYLDMTFSWYQGTKAFPFLPTEEEEEDGEDDDIVEDSDKTTEGDKRKAKEEKKSDPEVARYDAIKGLLKTKFLHRLRYILEVVRPPPPVVLNILEIFTRVARHSAAACSQLLDCPRLIETIVREFLPMQWCVPMETGDLAPTSLHGVPSSAAMKFLRVLASSNRHSAARLLHTFDMKSRLSRFAVQEPQDLPLPREEAERLSTETFRLWANAASYGQACDIYRELYPAVIRIFQSLPRMIASCRGSSSSEALSIQRAAAVITLLSHVTQTAGCTAELEAQLHSTHVDSEPQIPPPGVSWDNVTGLLPIVQGCLQRCLQEVGNATSWNLLQPLTLASINFLASYFQAASRQPSLNTVLCNEEMEKLTESILLPLLNQPDVESMWDVLRSCSAVCNPLTCSPLPESVSSIATLGCAGRKPPLSLPGKKSPFPILTAVLNLICSISNIHKGLVSKFSYILEYKGLQNYMFKISESLMPAVTPSSCWLLRHEYHFQYFILSLLYKVASMSSEQSHYASIFHSVSLTLVSRLLPGSEHLAHKILTTFVFNPVFMPEGSAGGPQAVDLSDILHITSEGKPAPPGSAASASESPSRGVLLEQAFKDLPSIQTCYITHFAHIEQALNHSRVVYQEKTCFVQSAMLPEARGPILPFDWPFLPLINLYNQVTNVETKGKIVNSLSPDLVNRVTRNLQWLFLLETWRPGCLQSVSTAAKLARLACVFLTGSDLFLEAPVHAHTAALTVLYSQPKHMESLKLDVPLPGLASFYDFYMDLLEQFEGVSFGDPLFGTFVLLPLQRRFSVQLKQAVFGEHVNSLRSLCVPLKEFPVPLDMYTSPPEDNLNLLHLYFRTLVMGALRQTWCPVLYVVALAHVNSFIFSQDHVAEEVDAERKSMLRKANLLVEEGLRKHLLYFKQLSSDSPLGFQMYDELPPVRQKYLKLVAEKPHQTIESS